MDRNFVSASVYLVLAVVAIVSRIWVVPYLDEIGVFLTLIFLSLEISRAPALQRNMGLLLAGIGVLAAWLAGDLIGAMIDGLIRAQIFLVMFFAVTRLREPAVTSS